MGQIERGVYLVVIVLLVGLVVGSAGGQSADTWWFTADREVRVSLARDINAPVVQWVQAGESVLLHEGYVQADDLLWARVWGTDRYIAVARYGVCEVRSFGRYDPPEYAPASSLDTSALSPAPRVVPVGE